MFYWAITGCSPICTDNCGTSWLQHRDISSTGDLTSHCIDFNWDTNPNLFPIIDGAPLVVKNASFQVANSNLLAFLKGLDICLVLNCSIWLLLLVANKCDVIFKNGISSPISAKWTRQFLITIIYFLGELYAVRNIKYVKFIIILNFKMLFS